MRPFSEDPRLRIHEARQAGETTSEVAERFGVSTQPLKPGSAIISRPHDGSSSAGRKAPIR